MKLIPYVKHHIDADDISAVVGVLESDFLTHGPLVEVFEEAVAEYKGARYAVAISSGTAALHFAGMPCDMPAISAEAEKAGAFIIEDAAHAIEIDI